MIETSAAMKMLSGCRVLDCSDSSGWMTGRILADLGADVIKIDPAGVDYNCTRWQAFNVGKRSIIIDIGVAIGRDVLDKMIVAADVLIESVHPASPDAQHFDPERIKSLNSSLVHVSITPFGRAGPRAQWLASDLELMAAGGAMSLAGEPGGIPTRVSEPQSYCWAAANASLGALVALAHRNRSGVGQHVDVSAQASVLMALSHAPAFYDLLNEIPTRGGAFMTGRSINGAKFRAFWPCSDGYLNFIIYGGPAGRRTNLQLLAWMHERDFDSGPLREIDWSSFTPTQLTQNEVDRLEEPIGRFFLNITKREFLEEASRREMLGYPVSTVEDIARDPQLEARDFWVDLDNGKGLATHLGGFLCIDGKRPIPKGIEQNSNTRREILREFGISDVVIDILENGNTEGLV